MQGFRIPVFGARPRITPSSFRIRVRKKGDGLGEVVTFQLVATLLREEFQMPAPQSAMARYGTLKDPEIAVRTW